MGNSVNKPVKYYNCSALKLSSVITSGGTPAVKFTSNAVNNTFELMYSGRSINGNCNWAPSLPTLGSNVLTKFTI